MPAINSDNLKSDQKSAPPEKEVSLNEFEIPKNFDEVSGEQVSQNQHRRKRDLPAIYQREQVGFLKTNNLTILTTISTILTNISIIRIIIIILIISTSMTMTLITMTIITTRFNPALALLRPRSFLEERQLILQLLQLG